jgi:hypothetical protein
MKEKRSALSTERERRTHVKRRSRKKEKRSALATERERRTHVKRRSRMSRPAAPTNRRLSARCRPASKCSDTRARDAAFLCCA